MLERFVDKDFAPKTRALIDQANAIIENYRGQGFTLTVRQLYYQFVARGLIPNSQSEYKRIVDIVKNGRLAGLIDWDMIEDRTRSLRATTTWVSPADIIGAAADGYTEDLWIGQDRRPEVWIEKEALVGVIERACRARRVPFFACRGYASQTSLYDAGKRFAGHIEAGLSPLVLHLGDHDPSGIDMTRDNQDRLNMFADAGASSIEVQRLALNMDQIETHKPPPNPAKEGDSRSPGYIERFGHSSWELDALDPALIARLISDALDRIIDPVAWAEAKRAEASNQDRLALLSQDWPDVSDWLDDRE